MDQKALEARHPLYGAQAAAWQYFADQYAGGPGYATKTNPLPQTGGAGLFKPGTEGTAGSGKQYSTVYYVWQYPLEITEKFVHRLNRACCVNICAPVVDFYCATVGKPENVLITPDPAFEELLGDMDRQGHGYHQFMAAARTHATVRGLTFLLVDSTRAAGEVVTERDARDQGIRPYVVEILPEHLLNWRLDEAGRPVEILYRVKREVPGSILDPEQGQQPWEYRYWDAAGWAVYRDAGNAVVEVDRGPNPLGVVPLVALYHRRGEEPFAGESLLKDAGKIQQLVTNWASALDEAFETSMFAVPVVKSKDTPQRVGAGSAVILHLNPEEKEDFYYVTPDTQPFQAGWDAFYRMIQLANKHMGIAPKAITTDKIEEQSGVAKEWDFFEAEKILAAMALNEQEAAKEVLRLMGLWLNREFAGSIQYATRYDLSTAKEDLDDLVAMQTAGAPATAQRELMRRFVAKKLTSLSDEARTKIDREIEAMRTGPAPPAFPAEPPARGGEEGPPEDEE